MPQEGAAAAGDGGHKGARPKVPKAAKPEPVASTSGASTSRAPAAATAGPVRVAKSDQF